MKKVFTKFTSLLYFLSILLFIIAFNFSDNPVGHWYQQFMPNLNGRPISDITFLDSLVGYAVTGDFTVGDTNYVLKTTNGGDNWSIMFQVYRDLSRVKFINQDTGFICGGFNAVCSYLAKTTNGGVSWLGLNTPCNLHNNDMSVLNEVTIRVVDRNSFDGGVYLTTDGGASWQNQGSFGSNPDHIYMFNARIGFIGSSFGTRYVRKTTDSGLSWFVIVSNEGFSHMFFADSLTGWKSTGFMKKTTDGGLNWVTQTLPFGGMIQTNGIGSFSNVSRDTIWGNGGYVLYPNNQVRGILNRTTNGGDNWLFQVPDTSIHIGGYGIMNFTDRFHGWALGTIHTTTGGDTIFYTPVEQITNSIPKQFQLFQNYPNPFNISSKFKVVITSNVKRQTSNVKVKVYDVTGREVSVVLDKKLAPGEYEITFDAKELPSGVYFYSLFVDGNLIDTKKAILLK